MPAPTPIPDARPVALLPSRAVQVLGTAPALLEAMRPKQWVKNVFVLAGLVFAGQLFDSTARTRASVCFLLFCSASSAVYLMNDIFDRSNDLHHPIKRLRAIPSGRLPVPAAAAFALLLAAGAIAGSFALSRVTFLIVMIYLASSAGYTSGLKRIFILDVLIVASGFVLRAAAGAAAVGAEISPWLICCTFLLALYLALGKRRHELTLLGESARQHRDNLGSYSVPLLDSWLTALSAPRSCATPFTRSHRGRCRTSTPPTCSIRSRSSSTRSSATSTSCCAKTGRGSGQLAGSRSRHGDRHPGLGGGGGLHRLREVIVGILEAISEGAADGPGAAMA